MTRTNALLVLVVVAVAVAGLAVYEVFRFQKGDTAALCAFRSDLQHRVDSGAAFLLTHPHGIPGISAPTILQSLHAERSTLRALKPVNC